MTKRVPPQTQPSSSTQTSWELERDRYLHKALESLTAAVQLYSDHRVYEAQFSLKEAITDLATAYVYAHHVDGPHRRTAERLHRAIGFLWDRVPERVLDRMKDVNLAARPTFTE